jgi:enoyl-CoA hydratase
MGFEDYERIRFERDGDVLIMTLNRPEKLNAVDGRMHSELVRAFVDVEFDEASRVVVLTGAGRGFCSGGDVGGMDSPAGSNLVRRDAEVRDEGRRLIEAMLAVEKPLIAMVNGPAVGLGATLALFCDIIVAAEEARFGDRHVNVGLVAGDGGAVIWPLLVGMAKAKEFLMTGRLIPAAEAERIGLINRVVPGDRLRDETMALARELAELPPFAVRATKLAVNRQLRRAVEEVLDVSLAWEHLSMLREDHREAARRFLQRRQG